MLPQNNVYIYNTRTNGQNPNYLGANFNTAGNLVPALGVNGSNLKFNQWNIVQSAPGLPYCLQISDSEGNCYNLAAPVTPTSNAACSLQLANDPQPDQWFIYWNFSIQNRILLAWNLGTPNPPQFSLDTGHYPQLIIYTFASSVNQTWQYGTTAPSD